MGGEEREAKGGWERMTINPKLTLYTYRALNPPSLNMYINM